MRIKSKPQNLEHPNSIHPVIRNKLKLVTEKYNKIYNTLCVTQDETMIDDFTDLLNEFSDELDKKLKHKKNLVSPLPPSKVNFIIC